MNHHVRSSAAPGSSAAAILLVAAITCALPAQQEPSNGSAVNDTRIEIAANGDANERVLYKVTTADWNRMNANGIGGAFFYRLMGGFRADWQAKEGSYSLQPHQALYNMFEMNITELGAARNRGGGNWEYKVPPTAGYITDKVEDGCPTIYFTHEGNILPAAGCISAATVRSGLGRYSGPLLLKLPKEATNVKWEARTRLVKYRLPTVNGTGASRLEVVPEARQVVMSTAYKIYGLYPNKGRFSDQWVARTVFTNPSDNVIKNVSVTYKMRHADDVVHTYEEILPGQTVVDVYYPSFLPTIMDDQSGNTLPINISWTYLHADGTTGNGAESASTNVEGRNGFVFSDLKAGTRHEMLADDFSNAPMLAAWVSQNDDMIKSLATSAQDFATRLNANMSVEDKLAWMYNLMMVAEVQYKYPATKDVNGKKEFDKQTIQKVYLPRDVFLTKGGTCIDLAICYAALANELGFQPYLMLIPGHCFPVIKVGADYVPVETTMIQAGPNGGKPWSEARKVGQKEFEDHIGSPDALLIDVKALWADGINPPQLKEWDPATLNRLGLDRDALWERLRRLQNNVLPNTAREPQNPNPVSPVSPIADGLSGKWLGQSSAAGNGYAVEAEIDASGRTLRFTLTARLDNALVVESYEGPAVGRGGSPTLRLKTRTVTDTVTNEVRRDMVQADLFLRPESSTSLVVERVRLDRNGDRETIRMNRA